MNNEKTRSDFIFFQNEILGDVKKIESKLMEKMTQTVSFLETQSEKYDNKLKDLGNKYNLLSKEVQEQNKIQKYEEMLHLSQRKIEEVITRLEIKLNILEKDFRDSRLRYDKIISDNLLVPGLIGNSCTYNNLRLFLEHTNLKIHELLKAKDKQVLDVKKYKEKLESLISQNNAQFEIAEKKMSDYCNDSFDQCDKVCKDRMNLIEKRIESLRLENGKYAYDLKLKTEELQIDWERLNKIENSINKKYNEEWNKYLDIVETMNNKLDKNSNEFYLIKKRFTELSLFIKDIRFRNHLKQINEINQEDFKKDTKPFKGLSDKIDFNKGDKEKKVEIVTNKEIFENEIKENKEDTREDKIDNINNNEQIKNTENKNDTKRKKSDYNNETKKINESENDNRKIPQSKFNKNNSLNLSERKFNKNQSTKSKSEFFGNNSDFQSASRNIKSNNIFEVISLKDIKNIRKRSLEYDRMNNDNNTYNFNNDGNTYQVINYNRNFNDNREFQDNKNNENNTDFYNNNQKIKKDNEQNLMFLVENAKINNLILGADFSGNNLCNINSPTYNLSQAYMIIQKRNEEMKKMRKTSIKKVDQKFNMLSPSSSLNHSRNLNNNNSSSFNYSYTKRDFKKNNKEDLYYSTIKKDKIKKIGNKNIKEDITNQENYNNHQQKFPKINKDKNENSNNTVELNTININNNLFNKSLTRERNVINLQKKLINSSSDKELLIKFSPFSPVLKEHFLKSNRNSDEKNQFKYNVELNAKETLSHINPYLIQKFKNM
jgi:hypothetical protein